MFVVGDTAQVMKLEDALNIFHARNFAYDILRRFFIEEPSKAYLKQFSYKNMIDLFPFQEESEGMQVGIKQIKQYLSDKHPVENQKDYDDLHWDYTRMFIGPFDIQAFPWESSYVRKDNLLYQETTMDVRKYYQKFSFASADRLEVDDHIGLELDFIFHLNALCIESSQLDNPNALKEVAYLLHEQQAFIQKHLGNFVEAFCDRVIDSAETDFYAGMALVLKHYISIDLRVLNELLNIHLVK